MMEITRKSMMDWTRKGMRKSFGSMLELLAEQHEDIVVMAADVASSAGLQSYAERFPGRFFNLGISEQNMTGVAAGMAKEGCNVFIVSFAPFVSMRAYEAVRTLVGYMHLNVKVVALASGFSLGVQGNTHYGLEDISLMRTIPGMTILSPADCLEEFRCLEYLSGYEGPAFLRLTGIDGSPAVYRNECDFSPSSLTLLREGTDVAVFATGSITAECVRAARALKKEDISCAVYDAAFIKPLNLSMVEEAASQYRLLVSVEEHFLSGGLGSMLAEKLTGLSHHAPLLRIGVEDEFPKAGGYAYMLDSCGLNAEGIIKRILEAVKEQCK